MYLLFGLSGQQTPLVSAVYPDAATAKMALKGLIGTPAMGADTAWYIFDLTLLRGRAFRLPPAAALPDPIEFTPS